MLPTTPGPAAGCRACMASVNTIWFKLMPLVRPSASATRPFCRAPCSSEPSVRLKELQRSTAALQSNRSDWLVVFFVYAHGLQFLLGRSSVFPTCSFTAAMTQPIKYQGVDKQSSGYKLLAAMGWQEGSGLVSFMCAP